MPDAADLSLLPQGHLYRQANSAVKGHIWTDLSARGARAATRLNGWTPLFRTLPAIYQQGGHLWEGQALFPPLPPPHPSSLFDVLTSSFLPLGTPLLSAPPIFSHEPGRTLRQQLALRTVLESWAFAFQSLLRDHFFVQWSSICVATPSLWSVPGLTHHATGQSQLLHSQALWHATQSCTHTALCL